MEGKKTFFHLLISKTGEMMVQTLGRKKLLQSTTVGPKCPTAEKTHGLSIFILLLHDEMAV